MKEKECILITVSGIDHPGITHGLMKIIADANFEVLDLSQSTSQGLLSLSIILQTHLNKNKNELVLKNLLFEAKNNQLLLNFKIVNLKSIKEKIHKTKVVIHCISKKNLSAIFLSNLSKVLKQYFVNIYKINNNSKGIFNSLEITADIPSTKKIIKIKNNLFEVSHQHKVDIALIEENLYRINKRLIVFDMDSTLITTEVIDEMAKVMGVEKEIIAITKKAMEGKMNFKKSLIQRVALLRGFKTTKMTAISKKLPLTPSIEKLLNACKDLGYKTAIISGGFSFFTQFLKKKLKIDYAFGNELEIKNNQLTGNVLGNIIDSKQKGEILEQLAKKEGISLKQTVAIGDGANDLLMLSKAGLGIAFNAREIVQKKAKQTVNHNSIASILYLLGIYQS